MSKLLKGKQIEKGTIKKDNLFLEDPTLDRDPVTKIFLENKNYVPSSRKINGLPFIEDIDITKYLIGLGNVDNTKDIDKPVSAPQKAEIDKRIYQGSLTQFTSDFDTSQNAFYLTDKGKEGLFTYSSTSTAANDNVLVLVKNNKRYLRQHDRVFYPSWWGVDETGTTNVTPLLNQVFDAASKNGATVEANGTYLISETLTKQAVLLYTSLKGSGTFLTRNSASLKVMRTGITIKDITIDGGGTVSGASVGTGITNDGFHYLTVDNVKVRNITGQGIWSRGGDFAKFINNNIRRCVGSFGDGIYSSQANNVQIINNQCYEFQRIGIAVEGNDTNSDYSKNCIIMGNICRDAIFTTDETKYPNGGIWCENVADITIIGNQTENTFFRGIAITPSVEDGTKHKYIISNNIVKNCFRTNAAGLGYGIAVVYATGQDVIITDNHIVDCQRGIGLGDMDNVVLDNNIFSVESRLGSEINNLISIDFIRTTDVTKKCNVYIRNCVNLIPDLLGRPITIPNVNNLRGYLEIDSCKGDFSFVMGTQMVLADILVKNSTFNYSNIPGGNTTMVYTNGVFKMVDCELITGSTSLFPASNEFILERTKVSSPTGLSRFTIFSTGARVIKVIGCQFKDVYFNDIRRANHEIYLKDSKFEGYSVQGLFFNTVTEVASLHVDGCEFDKTSVVTPLKFAAGVATLVLGKNLYYTGNLYETGNGSPTEIVGYRQVARRNSSNFPTAPRPFEEFFNDDISMPTMWNGSRYVTVPDLVTNTTTTAPTKATLNTAYGLHPRGFRAYYPNRTGGARIYTKLADGNASDWMESTPTLLA